MIFFLAYNKYADKNSALTLLGQILNKFSFLPKEILYVADHTLAYDVATISELPFIGIKIKEKFTNRENLLTIVSSLAEIISILDSFAKSTITSNYIATIQKKIHEAISEVGGYWPPLAAVSRLLEEIGELFGSHNTNTFIDELADIYIISTCLANQYSARLSYEPYESYVKPIDIIVQAGKIARIVNFYDGPKQLKAHEKIDSIEKSVSKLHSLLISYSEQRRIDIIGSVFKKIEFIKERDLGRFQVNHDPSSAQAIQEFDIIQKSTKCPYAKHAKIWGANLWDNQRDIEENLELMLHDFKRFIKISPHEGLDVFILAAPKEYGQTIEHLAEFTRRTLTFLAKNDSAHNCIENDLTNILTPGWHFNFAGLDFFITTFSPCYSDKSPRSTYGNDNFIFLLFQPEHSFKRNLPLNIQNKIKQINRIRMQFEEDDRKYDREDIYGVKLEALKYVKPISMSESTVSWWRKRDILFSTDSHSALNNTNEDVQSENNKKFRCTIL